jgi:hypothetical protein
MSGERTGSLRFGISADQVNGSEAVNGEPPDMSLADPVWDFLKTESIGVEGCACIDIPHKKRDMVEGEMIRHRQAFPGTGEPDGIALSEANRECELTHRCDQEGNRPSFQW